MAGVSVDFVGYRTGAAGAAGAAGFFGLFDGTGIPVGVGGGARAASMPARLRKWCDPMLARAYARDWAKDDAKRALHVAHLRAAVERLENIGRTVAPLQERAELAVAPYRVKKVLRIGGGVEPGVDYLAMLESQAFLKQLDDLLEWADEEEILMAFIASGEA